MTRCFRPPFVGPAWLTAGRVLLVALAISAGEVVSAQWRLAPMALLVVVFTAFAVAGSRPKPAFALVAVLAGTTLGALAPGFIVGDPLGGVLSAMGSWVLVFPVHVVLVVALLEPMLARAHDAVDQAVQRAGLWLLVTSVAHYALRGVWLWRGFDAAGPLAMLFATMTFAFLAVVAATARLALRRRWHLRVQHGLVPDWRIVPQMCADDARLPFLRAEDAQRVDLGVLEYLGSTTTPYREPTPGAVRVALAPWEPVEGTGARR